MTNTSFVNSNSWAPVIRSDVSILVNNDISTLRHFRTNSCERKACVRQILELCFSCFRSCHSFRSVTNSASVNHSTSLQTAKMSEDAAQWFFLSNKEFYCSTLYCTSLTDQIVRRCCSGTLSHKALQLGTKMLESSNLFLLKSHIPSLLTCWENKYGILLSGQPMYNGSHCLNLSHHNFCNCSTLDVFWLHRRTLTKGTFSQGMADSPETPCKSGETPNYMQ
jgi:hypothetical protein